MSSKVCPVRNELAAQLRRRLDHYTQTIAVLIEEMTPEEATVETKVIYDSCVEARTALYNHERDHECSRD
jgi:hypothetical protein